MNRFMGISGLIHLAIFAGIIYFCATYDYSSPNKVDKTELEIKASGANPARSSNDGGAPTEEPRLKEVSVAPAPVKAAKAEKTEDFADKIPTPNAKALKAIERIEKNNSKKAIAKTLPQANFAPRSDDKADREAVETAAEEGIAHAKAEMNEEQQQPQEEQVAPIPVPVTESEKQNTDIEQERQNFANKSMEEKRALLAKLKSMNADADAAKTAADKAAADKKAQEQAGVVAANGDGSGKAQEGEVRSLEEFRQAQGNPRPAYDDEDRLKGRQGTVVFKAFVTKEGTPKDFEILESSGHRSLDLKTLKALKQWKFQAGQEGFVEIPFRWDLKGGPQELPSTLRKKVSTKQDSVTK